MVAPEIPAWVQSLDLSREDEQPRLGWLDESFDSPITFWTSLFEHANRVGPKLRSRPGKPQDLYYDLVERHVASSRPAFVWHEPRAERSLSFAELHVRASACALVWAERGVKAGSVVALVLPMGAKFVVALAAALRLGLVVSVLEPFGPYALAPRLALLKPKHVVFEPDAPPAMGEFADLYLPVVEDGPPHRGPAYAYAPDEPCARLFSPLRAPPNEPVDLAAEIALENALRDAFFTFRLNPGDVVTLPDFPMLQHQPAVLFSAWIVGASLFHVSVEDIKKDPTLLEKTKVTTLGISPTLLALLTSKPKRLAGIKNILRSVDDPLDWIGFRKFVEVCGLLQVLIGNVLIDAAVGGCLLFSTRRPGSGSARVLPAAGRPYALLDCAGTGKPAEGKTGLFSLLTKEFPKKAGFFIIASIGAEFLYGSTLYPRRASRVYPSGEVIERALAIPGVSSAVVLPIPTPDPGVRYVFVLVVFTGAHQVDLKTFPADVEKVIREDLGEDFLPDRVEVFPLYARQVGREVDLGWCSQQYSSGALQKKAASGVFRDLTTLRGQLLGP